MGKSSQTTTQSIPQWQEDFIRQNVFPIAENIAGSTYTPYTGEMTAGMSGYTTGAADLYKNIGGLANTDYAARTAANMNPYQQSVIDASLAQMNRQQAQDLTNLEAQQIRSGAFGSRGEVARGEFEAANALDRNKLISELNQTGFTNAQNLTMDQIASEAGVLGTAASGLTGIGSLDTAINQAGLDAKFNEFLRQQGFDANKLSQVLGAAQGNYGGTTTATSKPGLFDYLSAAATAASSDIRLKKDITPAGKMNGVQFYTWNWNEDGEKFASHKQIKFGVIAQEIQKTHPQYVAEDSNGYLRVNYGDLVKELAA